MKILCINNYDLEWAYKDEGNVPIHQTWGVSYLRKKGFDVKCIEILPANSLISKIASHIKQLFITIKVLLFSRYDLIIAFYSPCLIIKLLCVIKKRISIRPRLFMMIHHYGTDLRKFNCCEKIFFLSRPIMERYMNEFKISNGIAIDWAADLPFYEQTYNKMKGDEKVRLNSPILISTGKSSRDNCLLAQACEDLKVECLIFDDESVKSRYGNSKYIKIVKRKGYPYMLEVMSKCAINVVPCKNGKNSLCGLTSVIDGFALGMPTIVSDNCNLSYNIDKDGIGLVYKAGDLEDLKDKITQLISDPKLMKQMGGVSRKFAEVHDYNNYCKTLYKNIFQ